MSKFRDILLDVATIMINVMRMPSEGEIVNIMNGLLQTTLALAALVVVSIVIVK